MVASNRFPKRRGNTRAYRTKKLADIEETLERHKHHDNTPTPVYGEYDPLSVPLNACEQCGGDGVMTKRQASKGIRWLVVCQGCSTTVADPVKRPWAAGLAWNGRHLACAPDYRELPLFGLDALEPDEAVERLKAIRTDLEARKKAAGLRRSLRQENKSGGRPPGRKYQERLEAYLQWALYAIRVVRFQQRDDNAGRGSKR